MSDSAVGQTRLAARGAYAGAALFVALIVGFSAAGPNASANGWVVRKSIVLAADEAAES